MTDVVLAYPGYEDDIYPPLGQLHIAAVLRENNIDVSIVDFGGEKLNENKIIRTFNSQNPLVVGITSMTGPMISRALMISNVAKKIGAYVVWGGPHATILPEQTVENSLIDYAVVGEGEYTFLELVQELKKGNKCPRVDGTAFKDNEKVVRLPSRQTIKNLDDLPMPAWDLLDNIAKYRFKFESSDKWVTSMISSRGCPYKCAFCINNNQLVKEYTGYWRGKSVENIIKEYEFIRELDSKIEGIYFRDDEFTMNRKRTEQFCNELIKRKMNIEWKCAARVDHLTDRLIKLMGKAGCRRMFFGIETGSPRMQKLMTKNIDLNLAAKRFNTCRKVGIWTVASFILGSPTETKEDLELTLQAMKKLNAHFNNICLYHPMPGSKFYRMSIESGKFREPKKLEEYANFDVSRFDVNVSDIRTEDLLRVHNEKTKETLSKVRFELLVYHLRNHNYRKMIHGLKLKNVQYIFDFLRRTINRKFNQNSFFDS